MASETNVQEFVHKLEEGSWVKIILRALLVAAVAYVVYLWFFKDSGFKGLNHERAIEQAQIGRELARGNGFSTKMIRPAALWQFKDNTGSLPTGPIPDTYHAPLNPFVNSFFLRLMKDSWVMTTKDVIYPSDKVLAAVQTGFFLLAVLVNFFTIRRLFDERLAVFTCTLLLLCQRLWDFSMSALPQMLLLFLFSGALYVLVRAVEARTAGKSTLLWAVLLGAIFGLLALGHALTLWIFGGLLLFSVIYFLPRGRDAAIMLAMVALIYGPWMVRNEKVCGNPLGLGWYAGLYQIRGTEGQVMRSMVMPLIDVTPTVFRAKVQTQILFQLSKTYEFLGQVLVAPVFFIALLHLFKRRETSVLRWAVLSMWLFAVFGMAVFGLGSESSASINSSVLPASDMHVLFIPMMTAYGMAFVLMMWSRLDINVRIVRLGFLSLIYLVSSLPFLNQFLLLQGAPTNRVQWPPYIPPFIAILGTWTNEREIIASDMPWGVAWYADRKSLWLPISIADFVSLSDYSSLGNDLVGLYLTPVSGDRAFVRDIIKGEYKEWSPFILRQVNVKDFPLRAVTAMPVDNECVFYSDRDRWTNRED